MGPSRPAKTTKVLPEWLAYEEDEIRGFLEAAAVDEPPEECQSVSRD